MWLFWLKLISMSIAVTSGVIAAYREMHPPPKPSKIPTLLFTLAIVFGATAIATEIIGYHIQRESEQERTADLQYIQALDLPLLRLGFDLTLESVPTKPDRELQWAFRFDKDLPTARGERRFYETINLHFSPDSGWHIMNERWRAVPLDSSENHLRFWIYDFGIKKDGIMVWQPKRIVDLTGLLIQMCIGPHDPSKDLPLNYQSLIQQVEIYVNSFTVSSRIVVAPLHKRSGSLTRCFYPAESSPYVDARQRRFYLNPFILRNSILESIRNNQ